MNDQILDVDLLTKQFGDAPAICNVSLSMERGQILCLLGPSGCGKTTLLRSIAGLETPDSGRVLFEGRDIGGVPPYRRNFGLMFQEFALFPHKSVGQNVAFGLKMKQTGNIEGRVQEMLELVGLSGFAERDVSSLSGGERQRVALARSLAPNPKLLMLDEPLGALDRAMRERLMVEIRQILKRVGLTAIYVTHDQTEAFAIADRVVVMNHGRIEQDSRPETLFRRPATAFVARFLGFENLLPAASLGRDRYRTTLGEWPIAAENSIPAGQSVVLLVRPEAAAFTPQPESIELAGRVTGHTFRGRYYQVTFQSAAGPEFVFETGAAPTVNNGVSAVWLNPLAVQVLPE